MVCWSLVTPRPMSIIPYIIYAALIERLANLHSCVLGYRYSAEQSINQQELRLQRVGGKSETEFITSIRASAQQRPRERDELARKTRLRTYILQPIIYTY